MRINIDRMDEAGFDVVVRKDGKHIDINPRHSLSLDLGQLDDQLAGCNISTVQREAIITTVHMEAHTFSIVNAIAATSDTRD